MASWAGVLLGLLFGVSIAAEAKADGGDASVSNAVVIGFRIQADLL